LESSYSRSAAGVSRVRRQDPAAPLGSLAASSTLRFKEVIVPAPHPSLAAERLGGSRSTRRILACSTHTGGISGTRRPTVGELLR
jgi:hypothetical protein